MPGKIHVGPDTQSRKEVTACLAQLGDAVDVDKDMETILEAEVAANMPHPISWEQVRNEVAKDEVMFMLAQQITEGFPPEKKLLRQELREYYRHRECLSQVDGAPL